MSALSETHLPSRRNDRRTARNRTGQGAWWTPIWAFFNSPLGLWFLSSVLLSTVVYIYQIWQQDRQQQEMTTQKIENLNLEIAGRVSQFGTWARVNLVHEQNGRYEFQESVNAIRIAKAIEELAAQGASSIIFRNTEFVACSRRTASDYESIRLIQAQNVLTPATSGLT